MGCEASDQATHLTVQQLNGTIGSCTSNCHCDFVKYSPVCGEDGLTYLSPCHAGCTGATYRLDGEGSVQGYENCSCIDGSVGGGGSAIPGSCKVDCWDWKALYLFMAFNCLNNFLSSSGVAGSILVGVR